MWLRLSDYKVKLDTREDVRIVSRNSSNKNCPISIFTIWQLRETEERADSECAGEDDKCDLYSNNSLAA